MCIAISHKKSASKISIQHNKGSIFSWRANYMSSNRFLAPVTVSNMCSVFGVGFKSNHKMVSYSYNIYTTIVPVGMSTRTVIIVAPKNHSWIRLMNVFLLQQCASQHNGSQPVELIIPGQYQLVFPYSMTQVCDVFRNRILPSSTCRIHQEQ